MKKTILIICLTALFFSTIAQKAKYLDNFSGLRSTGPVPADLKMTLDQLYEQDMQRVRDFNNGKLVNRDRILNASYNINKLMASGRILYGDPITRRIERIADTLLKDYPELRKELRFYTVKSPEVNAFATGQGMIFVNTGLVAQVEDEAQLAYVLSHEIIHYFRDHNSETLSTKKTRNSRLDNGDAELRDFIKRHNRSKEMENEADSLGLALFYINSPYDKRVTDGIFDVLQYGYLPFDEVVFDTNFFNTPYFRLPSEYFLEEVAPITARDDYNDSLSSHPNLLKRRTKTSAQLSGFNGGSHFVTMTENEFEEIRTLARFECIRLDIVYSEFARAFYDCYLLLRQYPDNLFLHRAMCQSLYGISKNKVYTSTNNVLGDYSAMEGEVQQVYYALRRIKSEEMALITARTLYKTLQRFPNDPQLALMCQDAFADLGNKLGFKASFFLTHPDTATIDTAQANARTAKYSRIKAKKHAQSYRDIRASAFIDLFIQYPHFADYLTSAIGHSQDKDKTFSSRKNQLIYSPGYYVVEKKDSEVKYLESYNKELDLVNSVQNVAKRFDMGTIDYSDQSLSSMTNASQYNRFVTLNEWVGEFMQTKGQFPMHFQMQAAMDSLMEVHDAGIINLSAVLNLEGVRGVKPTHPLFGIICPIALPSVIYSFAANTESTYLYTLLIDAQKGAVVSTENKMIPLADMNDIIQNQIYNTYLNIDTLHQADSASSLTLEKDKKGAPKVQVPGYLGRRFALSADLTLSPGFDWLVDANSGAKLTLPKALCSAFSPTVGIEYALKPNKSVIARYNIKLPSQKENYPFILNTAFLGIRTYGRKTYAPQGPYSECGITYAKLLPTKEISEDYFQDTKDNSFGIQIGAGRNYFLNEQVALNIAVRYSIQFIKTKSLLGNDLLSSPQSGIFISNLILLDVGIAYLPF